MDPEVLRASRFFRQSRFEFAAPRQFLLPALLLLLTEHPGDSFSLFQELERMRFGVVERSSVASYLIQLERDGLVRAWREPARPGRPGASRLLYGITDDGATALRDWMAVVAEERDCLARLSQRYHATAGTTAPVLLLRSYAEARDALAARPAAD